MSFFIDKHHDDVKLHAITDSDVYKFLRHIRNAYSHGDTWNFIDHRKNRKHISSMTWRSLTIQDDLHGKSCEDFLSYVEGLQLCAELSNNLGNSLSEITAPQSNNQIQIGLSVSIKETFSLTPTIKSLTLSKPR